MNILIV